MIWDDEEEEIEERELDKKFYDGSKNDTRKILSRKEKIIELLKDKYHSIKNGINNNTYKIVHENFDELMKNNNKINSFFKKDEIPSYYYECFALIEDIINISKDEQKKLSKENYNSLNSLKKNQVRYLKKIGAAYSEYIKNRKNDEKLEKDLENILKKLKKKDEEQIDYNNDIIELMKRDEKKGLEERRLKWVKKKKVIEEEKNPEQKVKVKQIKKSIK